MSHENLQRIEIPYVPFPVNPEKIKVQGFEVFKYIEGKDMDKYIRQLSDRNRLIDYDQVLVNWRGGWELFVALKDLQGYRKWPYICEIHRTDYGVSITKPVDHFLRKRKVLVVDDIYDRGRTLLKALEFVEPESRGVVAVWKNGVKNQIDDFRIDGAVKVDNVWLGGEGMDIGFPGEKEIFRRYRGLVAKP